MLYILRLVTTVIHSILICVSGSIHCLSSPRNPKHVVTSGHMFSRLAPLFGLRTECHKPADAESYGNAIYIASHQNSYGMVTVSSIVQPPTMTIGKKSLLWIPFFGRLYWLADNLLIDRNSRTKVHGTVAEVVNHLKERRISIWTFLEGTHSRSRGLLSFKTGAFHAAIVAGIPIIPVCVSTTSSRINSNRLYNGLVVIKMLSPIDVSQYGKDQVRELITHCRSIMG